MSKVNEYTSTGIKIIHHPDVLDSLKYGKAKPVSLQVAPTSRCNLNCVFCSNVNRSVHESLNYYKLREVISSLKCKGLKTIEWTGGGDPLCYQYINECTEYAEQIGLEQGLITNGVAARGYGEEFWARLMWVRISMNCLDYLNAVKFPPMPHCVLGFSYVMNKKTTPHILDRLRDYVCKYEPTYVRIVPDCQVSKVEQIENNKKYSEMVAEWGEPFFYQAKDFDKPDHCYWCYIKPFILHDGYTYPCSSVVLNDSAERSFHAKYRWCKMEDLASMYEEGVIPFDTSNCSHCVFKPQNDIMSAVLNPTGMEMFI